MAGFGLRQARSMGMDGYTGNLIEFPIDPGNTDPIFRGDPVIVSGGFIEEATGSTPGPVPNEIAGIFAGWRDAAAEARIGGNDNPFAPYWSGAAGTQDPIAHVVLPHGTTFYVRGDGPATQALVGTRRDLTYVAGDPRTADSRVVLDVTTANADGVVRVQRLAPLPGNAWTDDEPIIEVMVVGQSMTGDVTT